MTSSRIPLGLAGLILRKPCIMSLFTAQNTFSTRHVAKLRLKRRSFRECECQCSRSDDFFYTIRFYPTISCFISTCDSSGCFRTTKPILKIHRSTDSGLEDSTTINIHELHTDALRDSFLLVDIGTGTDRNQLVSSMSVSKPSPGVTCVVEA